MATVSIRVNERGRDRLYKTKDGYNPLPAALDMVLDFWYEHHGGADK